MLRLRDFAPSFDCTAVVECEVVPLRWNELHGDQNLVLLFDSIEESFDLPDELAALCDAADRLEILGCKLAVVCRDDEFEILTWMQRVSDMVGSERVGFPVVIDSDHRIVSLYEMLSVEGPLRGYVIADSNANVRSIVAHSSAVGLNVDELVELVTSLVEAGEDLRGADRP